MRLSIAAHIVHCWVALHSNLHFCYALLNSIMTKRVEKHPSISNHCHPLTSCVGTDTCLHALDATTSTPSTHNSIKKKHLRSRNCSIDVASLRSMRQHITSECIYMREQWWRSFNLCFSRARSQAPVSGTSCPRSGTDHTFPAGSGPARSAALHRSCYRPRSKGTSGMSSTFTFRALK